LEKVQVRGVIERDRRTENRAVAQIGPDMRTGQVNGSSAVVGEIKRIVGMDAKRSAREREAVQTKTDQHAASEPFHWWSPAGAVRHAQIPLMASLAYPSYRQTSHQSLRT